jgi:hypothetical protein
VGDTRSTVELAPFKAPDFTPKSPPTRYSMVKRASTEDERSQLVERVAAPARPAKWRVELAGERVFLRADGIEIELSADEARRMAETILRR